MRINPQVPRFNDDAPFNAEHWYSSRDLAHRNFANMSLFPAHKYHGEPSVGQVPVPPDPLTQHLVLGNPLPASGEFRLCNSSELVAGHKLAIDAPGLKIILVRSHDGVNAFDRRCPHRAIDLIDGHHDDTQIFCPGHGIAFDLNDGKSKCAAFALRRFHVAERDGGIWLLHGDTIVAATAT
jgi:nitrite reductase/ring-hydroxylating ferredoxin subunit